MLTETTRDVAMENQQEVVCSLSTALFWDRPRMI